MSPVFRSSENQIVIARFLSDFVLENADSARNYAVGVNQEVNRKFYECSNQRSMLQVEDFSKWRIPLMVRVAKGGKRTMQSLGISINPKYWDFTRNKPKPNCPNKEYIQRLSWINSKNYSGEC